MDKYLGHIKINLNFSGMGQTAIEYVDSADQERMRDEILTLLGLTHVPKARTQSPHYLQQLEELRSKANHTVIQWFPNF